MHRGHLTQSWRDREGFPKVEIANAVGRMSRNQLGTDQEVGDEVGEAGEESLREHPMEMLTAEEERCV